jgi:hypothetical protein
MARGAICLGETAPPEIEFGTTSLHQGFGLIFCFGLYFNQHAKQPLIAHERMRGLALSSDRFAHEDMKDFSISADACLDS